PPLMVSSKPYPFYIDIIFANLGLAISWVIVKDTRKFTILEIKETLESTNTKTKVGDLNFA
ncbi:MAG TPA: hypothetical protein VF220_07040, partial [Nitrososphaeraceae archaeon]